MLTDVDLQLPMVKNDAGEEVRLTPGTFPVYRESRSRAVREGAFRAMFGTYRQFGDAIAALYGGSVTLTLPTLELCLGFVAAAAVLGGLTSSLAALRAWRTIAKAQ